MHQVLKWHEGGAVIRCGELQLSGNCPGRSSSLGDLILRICIFFIRLSIIHVFKLTMHYGKPLWRTNANEIRWISVVEKSKQVTFFGLKYGVLQNSTLNTDICNKLDFCQPQLSKSSLCIALSLLSTKNVNHIYNLDLQLDNIIEPCVPIKILALTIILDRG